MKIPHFLKCLGFLLTFALLTLSCSQDTETTFAELIVEETIVSDEITPDEDAAEPVIDYQKGTLTLSEDTKVALDITKGASENSTEKRTYSLKSITQPKNGKTEMNNNNEIIYAPAADYNGTDSFSYTMNIQDSTETTVEQVNTFTVTITPTKDVVDDLVTTTFETAKTISPLANDTFSEASDVSITEISLANKGTAVLNADNTITYTPNKDATGEDQILYKTSVTNTDASTSTENGTLKITILSSEQPTGATIKYVTTTGKSTNTGATEATAWSITHAFNTAKAGDVVYIKAGNYGDVKLKTIRSGTASSPIKFIGYKDNPGDVVSSTFSTYTKIDFDQDGSVLKGTDMPLLTNDRGANNDPESEDRAISVDHNYIYIENFKAQYYEYAYDIDTKTTGNTLINFVANELGNWDSNNSGWNQSFSLPDAQGGNLSGYGIRVMNSSNTLIKNTIVFNAGHANVDFIGCDNITYENGRCYATKAGNSTDYMTILYNTSNSKVKNYEAYRVSELPHANRALVLICNSNDNVIEDIYAENLRVVVHIESNDNIFKNINLQGSGNPFEAEFTISSNSNRNIIYNYRADNSGGINFRGGDNQCGGPLDSGAGSDNYFINPIITNVMSWHQAAIDFGFQSAGNGSAGTNYIIGGTFDNADYLIKVDRPNDMLYLVNCTFSNITHGFMGSRDNEGFTPKITYDHVNFYKVAFDLPSGKNITSINPDFNSNNSLKSSSDIIDIGIDATSYLLSSNTDFNGKNRGNGIGWDIGAYEN